jgi:hypothetical protein
MTAFRTICAAAAIAVLGAAPGTAQAGFIISSETLETAPGDTGYVQILLKNDSTTALDLTSFSVGISLDGSGVQFTGFDNQTNPSYVFGFSGIGLMTTNSLPSTATVFSDISFDFNTFELVPISVGAGETVGLVRIAFEVDDSAATGLRAITFSGLTTQITDADSNSYAAESVSFTADGINVQGNGSVVPTPEPTSAVLLVTGLGCLGLFKVCGPFRRRFERPPTWRRSSHAAITSDRDDRV